MDHDCNPNSDYFSTGNGEVIGSNPMRRLLWHLQQQFCMRHFCMCGVEVSTFELSKDSGSNPDIKSVMNYLKTKNIKQNTRKRQKNEN